MAIRYAAGLAPNDRDYPGVSERPGWHSRVIEALAGLRGTGLVAEGDPLRLTPAGDAAVAAATARLAAAPADDAPAPGEQPAGARRPGQPFVVAGVISTPLRDPAARADLGFSEDEDDRIPVMAELNLQFGRATAGRAPRPRRPSWTGWRNSWTGRRRSRRRPSSSNG